MTRRGSRTGGWAPWAIALVVIVSGIALRHGASPPSTAESSTALVTDLPSLGTGGADRPLHPGTMLALTVTLRPSDEAAVEQTLAQLENPHSPSYRHFLDHTEAVARLTPPAGSISAVRAYFASFGGFGFSSTPDRLALTLEIPAAGAARALALPIPFPTASQGMAAGTPSLPGWLSPLISSISGLGTSTAAVHLPMAGSALSSLRHQPTAWVTDGSGVGEPWFVGSDYTSAFGVNQLWPGSSAVSNPSYASGTAVATLLMSGYNASADQDLPPFDPVVVQAYFNDTLGPGVPQPTILGVPITLSGVPAPAPAYFGNLNDTTGNSFENALDLEMAGSAAPGATVANFYFAGSLLSSPRFATTNPQAADDFAQLLSDALAYNYSGARLTAVSASIGLPDLNDSLWDYELELAGLMGVTVISASGDNANAPDVWTGRDQGQGTSWPASAAFNLSGTLAIGGTSVALDGAPTSVYLDSASLNVTYDPTVHAVLAQSPWFNTGGGFGNISGTVGGASQVYPEPYWQLHSQAQPNIVNATLTQGLSVLGRSEPDVAFPANQTVVYVARDTTGIYFEVLQGTSISAPFFAGMLASASAVSGHPYGFLDPELYRMASYYAATPSAQGDPYLDVTAGGNFLFSASTGWDATTGWGGWWLPAFLAADGDPAVRNYTYVGPTPGLPPGFTITMGGSTDLLLVVVALAVVIAVVIVITVARPRPRMGVGPSAPPPSGPYAPGQYAPLAPRPSDGDPLPGGRPSTGALPSPAFFSCPYCGAPRPAEPTRCPSCGQL